MQKGGLGEGQEAGEEVGRRPRGGVSGLGAGQPGAWERSPSRALVCPDHVGSPGTPLRRSPGNASGRPARREGSMAARNNSGLGLGTKRRGRRPAGKAQAVALSCAPDGDWACSAPRGPAPPSLGLAGTAGAPRTPSPRPPSWGTGGGAARAVLASSPRLGAARGWAGALPARCAPWGTSGAGAPRGPRLWGRAGGAQWTAAGLWTLSNQFPDCSEHFMPAHSFISLHRNPMRSCDHRPPPCVQKGKLRHRVGN